MSLEVYEAIGRRAVEILSTAQFAIQPPGSEKVNKKKKCKPTSLSCGFTCIAGNKTCRVSMTMEQQKAAAEIRRAARAGKKAAAPEETAPQPKTALDRIKAAHQEAGLATGDMELGLYAKKLERLEALENPTPAQREHIKALTAKPDKQSSEAALDRIDDLQRMHKKVMAGQELTDRDLLDLPETFTQGLRGGAAQPVTNAAALYTAEIYSKLSDDQKAKLAANWNEARGGKSLAESVGKNTGWDEASKPKAVQDFADDFEKRLKPEKGGGLVAKGGSLAVADKTASQGAETMADVYKKIDEKHVKPNMTDQEVDDWVNERLSAKYSGDPIAVSARTNEEFANLLQSKYESNPDAAKFAARIKDADSYAKTALAAEKYYKAQHPEMMKDAYDVNKRLERMEMDYEFQTKGSRERKIKSLEKKIASGKGKPADTRKLKELNDYIAARPERLKRAQEIVDKLKAGANKTDEERTAELKAEYQQNLEFQKSGRQRTRVEGMEPIDKYSHFIADNRIRFEEPGVFQINADIAAAKKAGKELDPARYERQAVKEYAQEKAAGNTFFEGIDKNDKAALRKKFLEEAAKHHPDKGGSKTKFQALSSEYDRLRGVA